MVEQVVLATAVFLSATAYTVIGAGYLAAGLRAEQLSPGVLPMAIGVLAVPISAGFLWHATREWKREHFPVAIDRSIVEGFAMMALFVAVFTFAKFLAAAFLFVFVFLYRFHTRSLPACLLYSALLTGIVVAIFQVGLHVPLF